MLTVLVRLMLSALVALSMATAAFAQGTASPSPSCDSISFDPVERFYFDTVHERAVEIINLGDQKKKQSGAKSLAKDFAAMMKRAHRELPDDDGRRFILAADAARFEAARTGDTTSLAAALANAYRGLWKTARTVAEADFLLSLVLGGDAYSLRNEAGSMQDATSVISWSTRHREIAGPTVRGLYPLSGYLAADNGYAERFSASDRIRVAAALLKLATDANSDRGVYEARINLVRDKARSGDAAGAAADATAVNKAAIERVKNDRDAILAGATFDYRGCFGLDGALASVNEAISGTFTRGEAEAAYTDQALEAAVHGELETDTFGASFVFGHLAAVKAIDDGKYREIMGFLADKELGEDARKLGLPPEVGIAIQGGEILESIMAPDLARSFFDDAERWLGNSDVPDSGRFNAMAKILGFEWRTGAITRFEPRMEAANRLLEKTTGSGITDDVLSDFHTTRARYFETRLDDVKAGDELRAALDADLRADKAEINRVPGSIALLKDHLLGRFCPSCGDQVRSAMNGVLDRIAAAPGAGQGLDFEFLLLVLTSQSEAIDSAMRDRARGIVENSDQYADWKAAFDGFPGKKPKIADATKLWLATETLGLVDETGTPGETAARTSLMLIEPNLDQKRALAVKLFNDDASHTGQFGGESDKLFALDRSVRLLQLAGYPASARVVSENQHRLTYAQDLLNWGAPDAEGRSALATILGPMHARMARFAFEDGDWAKSNTEIDAALALILPRLQHEWQFGSERAIVLYRQFLPALRLAAQIRLLLADTPAAVEALPGVREKALSDLQMAMLGDTPFAMQAAIRKRVLADPLLAEAVAKRDQARDRMDQLDAVDRSVRSKLPWVIDARRSEQRVIIDAAERVIAERLSTPEELASLRSYTLKEISAALEPNEAVAVLHSGSSQLYGYVIRKDREPLIFRSKASNVELAERVARLRSAASKFAPVQLADARALYDAALGPASAELTGVDHLIVVADGPLQGIPWSMLVTDGSGETGGSAGVATRGAMPIETADAVTDQSTGKVGWLIRRFPVSVAPTLGSVVVQRTGEIPRASKPFFGVGDPLLRGQLQMTSLDLRGAFRDGRPNGAVLASLAPLPETADELRALSNELGGDPADLRIGAAATRSNVLGAPLETYRVLAFATHGILAGEVDGVSEPGLVLSPEGMASEPGYLSLSDIMSLKLSADMVILSACNTGGADGRPRADSMSGLARGFIAAGAQQLMVTLWSIPSDPTTRLTTGTVTHLRADPALGWPRAMQKSILSMIDQPQTAADRHPASWAAFTILGAGVR